MIITARRLMLFQPAKYEKFEIEATIEVDTEKDEVDLADLAVYANEVLDNYFAPSLARLDKSSRTPEDDTYIHAWQDAREETQ